jgi:hypothetical protein
MQTFKKLPMAVPSMAKTMMNRISIHRILMVFGRPVKVVALE